MVLRVVLSDRLSYVLYESWPARSFFSLRLCKAGRHFVEGFCKDFVVNMELMVVRRGASCL